MIELAAAVIGDVDDLDAMIERDLGVLGGGDALDGERDLELALDALDGLPIERRLEFAAGGAAPPAGDMALGDIAFAAAVMRGVDGETEHAVVIGDRARDMVVGPGCVAANIELEHAKAVRRRFGDSLEAGIAHRAQHVGDAEFGGRLDHRLGAAGMEAFQRTDRAKHDRQAQLAAEHLDRRIDLADVAQHARPERDGVERHAVAPQRGFGLHAADDVIPVVLIEILAGFGDDFVQVEKFGSSFGVTESSRLVDDRYWLVHGDAHCGCRVKNGRTLACDRSLKKTPGWRRRGWRGGPGKTRTSDLRFRKPLLYPAELRDL